MSADSLWPLPKQPEPPMTIHGKFALPVSNLMLMICSSTNQKKKLQCVFQLQSSLLRCHKFWGPNENGNSESPFPLGIPLGKWGPPTSSTTRLYHECSIPKSQPVYMEPVLWGKASTQLYLSLKYPDWRTTLWNKDSTADIHRNLCDGCRTSGYAVSSRQLHSSLKATRKMFLCKGLVITFVSVIIKLLALLQAVVMWLSTFVGTSLSSTYSQIFGEDLSTYASLRLAYYAHVTVESLCHNNQQVSSLLLTQTRPMMMNHLTSGCYFALLGGC